MTLRFLLSTRHSLLLAAQALVLIPCFSCSQLTDVNAPDVVQPSSLGNAQGAETQRAGAVIAFATAYGGPGGQVTQSGTISDEFTTASLSTSLIAVDSRSSSDPAFSATGEYPYAGLHSARLASVRAIEAMQRFVPQGRAKIAQLFAQVGYAQLFFAENMCAGVPLSTIVDGNPVFGVPLTSTQLLEQALGQFDSAALYAADSARVLNMIQVARGRALLNLGRFPDAAQAVRTVASSYVFATEFAAVQPNGVFDGIVTGRILSVADREGSNGLDFRSANDPRIRTAFAGKGADGTTDVFTFEKYSAATAAIPLATGIEARLIESEAALVANPNDSSPTGTGWLGILNALRATATTPPLAPLGDPGTSTARVDLLFRERSFWLFATGHRHGDLRRLVRQYGRSTEQVFPTGSYKGRSVYGSVVALAVPTAEQANPNWPGKCLNRDP